MKYILLAVFSAVLFALHAEAHEEYASNSHYFSLGMESVSDESASGDYVVNGISHPQISGSYDQTLQHVISEYAFFFTPIPEDDTLPFVLRRFFTHPTTLRIAFDVSPESESTRIFENFENTNYRSLRNERRHSRNAACSLEWYVRPDTGIIFSIQSTKYERDSNFSNSLETQGEGSVDDIERLYGGGLSQYLFERLHLSFLFLVVDGETIGREESWQQESPLLTTETGWETTLDGTTMLLSTEYIFKHHFGLQGKYAYNNRDGRSRSVTSTYNDNFLGGYSYYDYESTRHTFSALVNWYVTPHFTVSAGGRLGKYEIQRDYARDLLVDYEGNLAAFLSSVSYSLTRHLGIRLGYEYTWQNLDTNQWYPDDPDLQTTYTTEYDNQMLSVGLTARF